MYLRIFKKCAHRLYTFTLKRRLDFPEDDTDCRFGIKAVTVLFFVDATLISACKMLSGFTFCAIISSLSTPFIKLITIVCSPTACAMLSNAPGSAPYFNDTIKRSGAVRFLWCPDLRTVNLSVNQTTVFF